MLMRFERENGGSNRPHLELSSKYLVLRATDYYQLTTSLLTFFPRMPQLLHTLVRMRLFFAGDEQGCMERIATGSCRHHTVSRVWKKQLPIY